MPKVKVVVELWKGSATIKAPWVDTQMLVAVGNEAASRIKARTMKGKGVDGALKPYSTTPLSAPPEGWRGVKPKGGKLNQKTGWRFYKGGYKHFKRSTVGTGKVNYSLSGQMLADLRVTQVEARSVTVFFGSPDSIRLATLLDKRSAFFGLNIRDVNALARVVQAHVGRIVATRFDGTPPPLSKPGSRVGKGGGRRPWGMSFLKRKGFLPKRTGIRGASWRLRGASHNIKYRGRRK